eukprot:gene62973-biopygen45925
MAVKLRQLKGKAIIGLNDHPDIRRCFEGFGMESLAIDYTVGGGANRAERQELIIYSWDLLFWGKSPEQTEKDLAAGVARLGGFRAPNYGQAYLLAANTLLSAAREKQTLDHHGLPIFFLQRHATELMIKAPLQLGIDVQKYREKLGKPRPNFPSQKQADRAENWHGLKE